MLAGGPRPGQTAELLGRPSWSLPLADDFSILDGWMESLKSGAECNGLALPGPALRILAPEGVDFGFEIPDGAQQEIESRAHRGTAGAVADLIRRNAGDFGSWILLLESTASPAVDLGAILSVLKEPIDPRLGVVLGGSGLGRLCGCMLVRAQVYDLVPSVGFFDFKEQLLPRAREEGYTFLARQVADRAFRVNIRSGWLDCIKAWHDLGARPRHESADWRRRGPCAISKSASIDSATVVNSVVMDGAKVGKGSVVARSIIGPKAVVPAGKVLVDVVHVASPIHSNAPAAGGDWKSA